MAIFKCRNCKKIHKEFGEAAKCCNGSFTGHMDTELPAEYWRAAFASFVVQEDRADESDKCGDW